MTTASAATPVGPRAGPRRTTAYFALGAIVGTLGDRIHTFCGVLTYSHPTVQDEAWWVVPLMGGAGVAMIESHARVARVVGDAPDAATSRDVAVAFAWFGIAYLASGIGRAYPLALTLAFVAAFVARALRPRVRTSRSVWLFALGTAVVGTLFESALSATGVFRYVAPGLVGNVPPWLPGLYLHAALLARAVARRWPG